MKTFTLKDRSEVDIRVSQEIKNHQDSMYQTGQQIQALARDVAAFSSKHEKVVTQANSDRKEVLIAFENLQQKVLDKLDRFCQRIGDLESRHVSFQNRIEVEIERLKSIHINRDEFMKHASIQLENLSILQKLLGTKSDYFDKALSDLRVHLENQVESVRKEIPSIEEFKPLKEVMDDHFSAFKVDFSGLVKEIALLKKSSHYDQKKFENIYTLIERLKEGALFHKKE